MDFINSLSPARKKSLLAAAILLIIALVIAGFLRLTGSSETDMAASAASSAQSTEEDPQSLENHSCSLTRVSPLFQLRACRCHSGLFTSTFAARTTRSPRR